MMLTYLRRDLVYSMGFCFATPIIAGMYLYFGANDTMAMELAMPWLSLAQSIVCYVLILAFSLQFLNLFRQYLAVRRECARILSLAMKRDRR